MVKDDDPNRDDDLESCFSPTNKLGRSYSSYNGDKDDKNQAWILKPGAPQLFHSASFHDNITNTSNSGSQNLTGKPTVIKLTVKRVEDHNGTRTYITLQTCKDFTFLGFFSRNTKLKSE